MLEPPRRRALWSWLVISLVLVVAGAIGALLAVRANSRNTSAPTAPPLTVAAAPRQMQPTRAESAESVPVPDVRGEELSNARESIRDAGLVPDQRKTPSSLPRDTVVAQSPEPGAQAERGDHVVLTVSQGSSRGPKDKDKHGHGQGPKNRR
jgi:cytoskeletal protein RodZ